MKGWGQRKGGEKKRGRRGGGEKRRGRKAEVGTRGKESRDEGERKE
jgi:hypothetical protein